MLTIVFSGGEPLYSRAASIDLGFESSDASPRQPEPRVIPTGYAKLASDGLRISFTNQGTQPASLSGSSSQYLALDPSGEPLDWGFANLNPLPSNELAPGSTGTLDSGALFFSGRASRLRVVIDFGEGASPSKALTSEPAGSVDERNLRLLEAKREARRSAESR